MSPTPSQNVSTLHHVLENQTGASKEAMIQANLMMQRLKEAYESSKLAYDASTTFQANVRVSANVSCFLIGFFPFCLDSVHSLRVFDL